MISSIFDKSSTKPRIRIQPLVNGYLVSVDDNCDMSNIIHTSQLWCFTDEESLGSFITEYYKGNIKENETE